MTRRVAVLVLVLAAVAMPGSVSSQEDWNVRASPQRERQLVERYTALLLRNPQPGHLFDSLVAKVGTGAGLDAVISDVLEAAAREPDAVKPRVLLGYLWQARGREELALAAFDDAIRCGPTEPDAHMGRGLALVRAARPQEAQAAFESALTHAATDAAQIQLLRRLADLSLAQGKIAQSANWLARLVALSPRELDLRVEHAGLLARDGQLDEAAVQLHEALQLAGRNGKRRAELLRELSSVRLAAGDAVGAQAALRSALELVGPGSWMRRELQVGLIETSRELGRLPALYDELRAVWSRPTLRDAIVLAQLADEVGRPEEAVRWLRTAVALDPRALEPRTQLIARLAARGEVREVRRLYDEVIALQPERLSHHLELADWLYFRQREAEPAMKVLHGLEQRWSSDADALVAIAQSWAKFGLPDRALQLHERVDAIAPLHVDNIEALGRLQAQRGDVGAAKKTWARLLESELLPLRAHLRRADLFGSVGEWSLAVEELEACVAIEPKHADFRRLLASAYESARRYRDAQAQWEMLVTEFEDPAAERRLLAAAVRADDIAIVARWQKRYEEDRRPRTALFLYELKVAFEGLHDTRRLLEEIVAVSPESLYAPADRLAWIEAAQRLADRYTDDEELTSAAQTWIRLGEAFGAQRALAYRELARLSHRLPPEEALARMRQALAGAPNDAEVQAEAGYLHFDQGNLVAATEALERALSLDPTRYDLYFDLAHFHSEADRTAEARELLVQAIERGASGHRAAAAGLMALDYAESADEVLELERRLRAVGARMSVDAHRTVMVAVYTRLFLYAEKPQAAFDAVGELALPLLVDALGSANEDERSRSLALVAAYPRGELIAEAARQWGKRQRRIVWTQEMVVALGRATDERAAPLLLAALDNAEGELKLAVVFALGLSGSPLAVASLAALVRAGESRERRLAAMSLGRLGGDEAVKLLRAVAIGDADEEVRLGAVWGLGATQDDRAVPTLSRLLGDRNAALARVAASSLGAMGTRASVGALFEAWWGPDASVRAVAQRGLRFVSASRAMHDEQGAQDLLEAASAEPSGRVLDALMAREDAATAVARARLELTGLRPLVIADLVAVAREAKDPASLGAIGRVVEELRPILREIATHDAEVVSFAGAALLLPHAKRPEDIPVVLGAAARLEEDGQAPVVEAMAMYRWRESGPALLRTVGSPEPAMRAAAVRVLARVAPPQTEARFIDALEALVTDSEPAVRLAAAQALGGLGDDGSAAVLADAFGALDLRTQAAVLRSLELIETRHALRTREDLELMPTVEDPCAGDADRLDDLLRDDCVRMLEGALP